MVLRGENPVRLQTLRFEQHVGQDNLTQIAGIGLYSLRPIWEVDSEICSTLATLPPKAEMNHALTILLESYHDIFNEPKGLPPSRPHDHSIPLKNGTNLWTWDLTEIQRYKRILWRRWFLKFYCLASYNIVIILLLLQWSKWKRRIANGDFVWTLLN